MDNQEIPTEEPKTTKKKLTEEQLKTRLKSLEKAVARKKELAELRKEEKNRIKAHIEKTIREPIPAPQPELLTNQELQQEIKKEKKKKTRIIEKVVEEPESSSSSEEEEIIERVIIKKVPRQKPEKKEDNISDIIEKTNKEILMDKMKEAQKRRAMAELFSF